MEFAQWSERYSVGDALMDAYHHIFFQALQELSKTIADATPLVVEERIAFLLNYASMHFDSEEQLMQAIAFPELEAHRVLHRTFKEQLSAIQARYHSSPSLAIAQELLELSQVWLSQHILGEDMKYRTYLKP